MLKEDIRKLEPVIHQWKMTNMKEEWKLYFDGSCSKESSFGAGVILEGSAGKQDIYHKDLGRDLTCNQTEYAALITGLEIAKGKGITRLTVSGEPQLVCKQVAGDWQVKSGNLFPYHQTIRRDTKIAVRIGQHLAHSQKPKHDGRRVIEVL